MSLFGVPMIDGLLCQQTITAAYEHHRLRGLTAAQSQRSSPAKAVREIDFYSETAFLSLKRHLEDWVLF